MIIYIALALIGLILFLIGVLGIAGSLLPQTHTATITVDVATPRQQVWKVLNDVEAFPTWLPEISKVEILPERNGHRTFRQLQGRNSFVLEETIKTEPSLVTRTIADDNKFFSGSWEHRLEESAPGRTRITLTEVGTIPSAMPRAIMRYLIGYDFFMKKFGQSLKAKFGS